ncbi:MAG: RDD family protein [Brevinematales bacterium]
MSEKKPFLSSVVEENTPQSVPMAPTWKRIGAFLIDYLFLNTIFALVFYLSTRSLFIDYIKSIPQNASLNIIELQKFLFSLYQQHFWAYAFFDLILWASYFILFWKDSGQTIGARIMNIRVFPGIPPKRPPQNLWDLPWSMCITRFFFFYLAIQLYGIPFLFVFDREFNIRFHDFFSRSVVISLPPRKKDLSDDVEK